MKLPGIAEDCEVEEPKLEADPPKADFSALALPTRGQDHSAVASVPCIAGCQQHPL